MSSDEDEAYEIPEVRCDPHVGSHTRHQLVSTDTWSSSMEEEGHEYEPIQPPHTLSLVGNTHSTILHMHSPLINFKYELIHNTLITKTECVGMRLIGGTISIL